MKVTVGGTALSYTITWDDATATTKKILGLVDADSDLDFVTAATATNTVQSLSASDIAAIATALINNSDQANYVTATDLVAAATSAKPAYDKGTYIASANLNTITVVSQKLGSSDSEKALKIELSAAAAASHANSVKSTAVGTFGSNGYAFGDMNFSKVLVKLTSTATGIINNITGTIAGTNTPITAANLHGADLKVSTEALDDYLTDNGVTTHTLVEDKVQWDVDNYPRADFVFAEDATTATTAASTTNKVSWL